MPACDAEMATTVPRRLRSSGGDYSPSAPGPRLPIEPQADRAALAAATVVKWRTSCRHLVFPALWLFIGLVAAFDTYLTVKFQADLIYHEINPLARMILRREAWDPSLLVGLKFLGSLLSLGFLGALHLRNRRLGLMVTAGLAAFQLGLLCYLVAA
jgi:hypothetical protein